MELGDTKKKKDEEMTSNLKPQTKQKFRSIALRLSNTHNSKLPINRVTHDILYNIFVLAVQTSSYPLCPGATAIRISSVCRYWRECALGWPILWMYIKLPYPRPILDLFLSRSRDAPLALTWSRMRFDSLRDFILILWTLSDIFSWLRSLTLHIKWDEIKFIQRAFQKLKFPPLRLQRFDVTIVAVSLEDRAEPVLLTDYVPIDFSCLQELAMHGWQLPWFSLPPNRLTNLTLSYLSNTPNLSQLLVFLSDCPLLSILVLKISKKSERSSPSASSVTTSSTEFYNLKELTLESKGTAAYHYIRKFSACIRTSRLSQFRRHYKDYAPPLPNTTYHTPGTTPFSIFETIPPGTFPQFASLNNLFITISGDGRFSISAGYEPPPPYGPVYPLVLIGQAYTPFDYSPIIKLIRFMPKLTHLGLHFSAWSIFTSLSDTDIRAIFPCLHTLALLDCNKMEALDSPLAYLRLETLVFDRLDEILSQTFLDAISNIGPENLIMEDSDAGNKARYSELADTLLPKGVHVWID